MPKPDISLVSPAYRESKNLPVLYDRIATVMEKLGRTWEWIIVDDHSPDETFEVVTELAARDPRVRGVRLARNYSSHTAITCGLHHARGTCAVVLAADLQDPPEVIPELLVPWEAGAQVVWAVRGKRLGEKWRTLFFAKLFYIFVRNFVGMKEMPAAGADFFLLDRRAIDGFCQFGETNVHVLALITWMGFRQETIIYTKQARLHGESAFNLEKRMQLVLDCVTSFTTRPIRAMGLVGFLVALAGFVLASRIIWEAFVLEQGPPEGYASLMVALLVIGGVQMLMMAVLGEYLWRALDEARRRPRFLIEAHVGRDPAMSEAVPPAVSPPVSLPQPGRASET
ncbi:MAG TPA: glycosyltransferase [Acidobacteria bacterium]|nr:glycosyltransferase [Acidobacteriota bacterium]HCE02351.1 glycosyltransferase [Acidobacteriota bacterium]